MAKIALIPGHGKPDPGAVNTKLNVKEADGNLAVSLSLAKKLRAAGYEVVESRTTDAMCGGAKEVSADVNNQIRFANASGADCAIAIHFNSFSETSHGTEVLYTNYPTTDPKELVLAHYLLDALLKANGLTNRGLKETPSGVGVIKRVNIPCVLSECAFVSNDAESVWCSDPTKREILAQAHFDAIDKWMREMGKAPTVLTHEEPPTLCSKCGATVDKNTGKARA
jgi:N-acetylmuramoyl-L-alanine amidase